MGLVGKSTFVKVQGGRLGNIDKKSSNFASVHTGAGAIGASTGAIGLKSSSMSLTLLSPAGKWFLTNSARK